MTNAKPKTEHCCLDKVRKQIMKGDSTITHVYFKLANIVTIGGKTESVKKTGQAIDYGFIHTKKNGEKVEKSQSSFISHDYCPFCGKKY